MVDSDEKNSIQHRADFFTFMIFLLFCLLCLLLYLGKVLKRHYVNKLQLKSRNIWYLQVSYDLRVIIYVRRAFIRLTTGLFSVYFHSDNPLVGSGFELASLLAKDFLEPSLFDLMFSFGYNQLG